MTHRDLLRVILWMTGALLSFSTMAVSIRGLATTLHIFEILAIRNASGLLILLAIGLAKPDLLFAVNLRRARLQLARNVIHLVRNICGRSASPCCRWRRCSRSNSPCRPMPQSSPWSSSTSD